jgi:hypothetical protein
VSTTSEDQKLSKTAGTFGACIRFWRSVRASCGTRARPWSFCSNRSVRALRQNKAHPPPRPALVYFGRVVHSCCSRFACSFYSVPTCARITPHVQTKSLLPDDTHTPPIYLFFSRCCRPPGFASCSDALPVYIGDDRTDEDAFKVLRKRGQGVGILVSKCPKETNASYSLQDPGEVMDFLLRLVEWKRKSTTTRPPV